MMRAVTIVRKHTVPQPLLFNATFHSHIHDIGHQRTCGRALSKFVRPLKKVSASTRPQISVTFALSATTVLEVGGDRELSGPRAHARKIQVWQPLMGTAVGDCQIPPMRPAPSLQWALAFTRRDRFGLPSGAAETVTLSSQTTD